ncbi:unnamed protein product, partial [Closterium sp. NIES-53]
RVLESRSGSTKRGCCGGSYAHAKECGAGLGVFLLVRRTSVMLLRRMRYATWLSPYLDAYGEE